MANVPQPESYEQLLSDMLSSYAAKVGIDDFNVGSLVTSFFEVVALITARASGDVFQILRDFSIDRATGDALKRLAAENNVNPITAKPATGFVNVIDSSFSKISTKVYAGSNPPNIGSTSISVGNASSFPSSGNIYIGRGTPNIEGPIPYSSISTSGGFFIIHLSVPTTKFHNVGESVILAQGGIRTVAQNTIVVSPSVGATADIQYTTTAAAVILDGEVEVDNVPVSALTPGASGNIPIGAIKLFSPVPFSGATVTNSLPFTTGTDSETDDQLRVRIKAALASIGLGTATAVKNSVIGATPSDEQATVVSDSLVTDPATGDATLYVDNGNGYEEISAGVGIESIVDSALGGEQFFQLATGGRQAPVAKAFLQSTLSAPFDLKGGDTLALTVGGVTYQHVFADSDFLSPGGATAFEVSASVNANTALGFEATTAGGGTFAVFRAISNDNDTIQIDVPTTSGRDASVLMGLQSGEVDTLRLYKNDKPLSKDGSTASVFTQAQALWSTTIVNGDTLILSVDGTAFITYTISDADFIATGLFTSVASTNSLAAWAQVFNAKLTGVTATVVGQQIELTSNLGISNRARISIDPSSTLVTKAMFNTVTGLAAQGATSDLTLSRPTAQFKLAVPLVAGDKLSAGSTKTQGSVSSAIISGGAVTFAADAHIWMLIDAQGSLVPTGVLGNTLLSVSKPSTNVIRYTSSSSSAFSTVLVGDYVIIWSTELPASDRLEGRVNAVTATTLDILVTPAEYSAATVVSGVVFAQGFSVLRSKLAPQKFRIQLGSKSLDQISVELQTQSNNLTFSVINEESISVATTTKDSTGRVLIVTSDANGKLVGFTDGSFGNSETSLLAFYDSMESQGDMPLFVHSSFASGAVADPIDSFINSITSSISLSGRDPNELLSILQPYGNDDAQPYGESVQESSIAGTTIGIVNESRIRRLRSVDRYFIANPLDFGSQDSIVAVLDNDLTNKAFTIPFYRRAVTNTGTVSNPNNFNAYDVDSGATANFSSAFGSSFDFSNYKVLMQAKKVLKPSPSQTALLYRSTKWGRSGEKILVGYVYPSAANSAIASTVVVNSNITILINLKSGAPVATAIDQTTEWNVTVTPNTPSAGIDQVTYTYSGTGTPPGLTLSGGEYVNIGSQTEFSAANTGIFRVSTQAGFTPTSNSFSVQRPTGTAVAETNKATLVNGAIVFYQSSATLASDINTYVNANMSDYFSSTIVNDGGTMGSGVIALSTYEDSGFTFKTVQLKDGINWLASSNLAGSPNFVFKVPLALPTDVGYAFNNAEEIRLIPTTMVQVQQLTSVLAVTGFTTVGTIDLVDRSSRVELSTNSLGSQGAVQIIGGLANQYEVPVLDSAARLDNSIMSVSVDAISSEGVHSDQWFRLQATSAQNKLALLSSNTSVTVIGNEPFTAQSTIQLVGRQLNQRYFGKPRHHVRPIGVTFKIEKQGSLVCISWNGTGLSPDFLKSSLNFNDSGGGTLNVSTVAGSNTIQYQILSGNANFNELSIGDLVTISGLPVSANNGTFLVTGVSDDGLSLQVLNPSGQNEFSSGYFQFATNSTAGDSFTIGTSTLIAGTDFSVGATQTDTENNLSAIIGTLPNVASTVNGNRVVITATSAAASIALAYSGAGTVTVSGAALAGDPLVAGTFTASSQVSEGDTVILASPFSVLNQGKFRIIRRYNDSVWIENANVVEEEVTLPANLISLNYDGTTSFKVIATSHTQYLTWNGSGTEPNLENAQIGDLVTFGNDFSVADRGTFMVLRSGSKQQQITNLTMPNGGQFALSGAGKYFTINSAGNINQYYVWFNVNSTNSDPAPGGLTGLQVNILSGDTAAQVATKAAIILNAATGLSAIASNNVVTVTSTGFQETIDAANFNMPSPFSVQVIQEGRRTFLECVNPSASNQSTVFITAALSCNRPQMKFYEYDATVPGDLLVVSGNSLGSTNNGSYAVVRVIDRDNAIVTGTMANASNVSLNGQETSVSIAEATPYSGYKQVFLITTQPGAPTRNTIVFNTNAQYEKIDSAAQVQMVSLSKMDFNTTVRLGLDSYRYNTGLIAEANRIVYGDPREPETYPGVGAAGAVIFVRAPLARRIQVSIVIRLNTGVPFTTSAQQVRTSVSALIKANPVGVPIAISAIVSAVNAISGIKAVSISSPTYNSTNDLIFIAPSEKAIIIDPTLDISVSQQGS